MNKIEIQQIIPAPTGMHAVHEFEGKTHELPIVSLALVKEASEQYVVALEMQKDGEILIAENEPDFMFILSDGDRLQQEAEA